MASNKGFTLIEVLIVVIILGIISAIALPSFLSQVGKSRETDARQQISTFLNKQRLYYTEKSEFAVGDNWPGKLGMSGIRKSSNYEYNLLDVPTNAELVDATAGVGIPKRKNIKAYLGVVAVRNNGEDEPEFISIFCRAKQSGKPITTSDLDFSEGLRCPGNTQALN